MRSTRTARSVWAACLVSAAPLLGGLAGCSTAQFRALEFTRDNRLSITAPSARQLVGTPFTVSWTAVPGFTATGLDGGSRRDAGVYAVFVDINPIKIGKDLKSAVTDPLCKRDPRCPTASQLSGIGVYTTTGTSLTVSQLVTPARGVGDVQHTVSVIMIDGRGIRQSESAWYQQFRSRRTS